LQSPHQLEVVVDDPERPGTGGQLIDERFDQRTVAADDNVVAHVGIEDGGGAADLALKSRQDRQRKSGEDERQPRKLHQYG